MKQKNLTGLRAGVYQESSDQKSTLFDLLASVLIFLALAAIGYTISGFAAMLWLLGAGALTCIAAAAIRHFKKTKLMFPILLAALLLVVLFARNPLLSGFGAAWNTLRDLWAAEKRHAPAACRNGQHRPLAGRDRGRYSACDGECRALARTDIDSGFDGSPECSGSLCAARYPAALCCWNQHPAPFVAET